MLVYDIISKTKNGTALNYQEISYLINGFLNGEIPDYQMSAWLMAVCINSLSDDEAVALTEVMKNSGDVLDLSEICGVTADKHSTGGVGDKTTLIVAPIVAACGVFMPKMSGRGLGHTGGTIDKLESIPGLTTDIPYKIFTKIINDAGFSIISQSGKIAPADKLIYALRDVTATVDSIPLIASSIMSKKLVLNADCILLDVKMGSGAFMKNISDAVKLAELMVKIAVNQGKKCRAMITDMSQPLGSNIGNSLEIIEAVEILKGNNRNKLFDLCISMASQILTLSGMYNTEAARIAALKAIDSGCALEKLCKMIELQNGNPKVIDDYSLLPAAKYHKDITALKSGYLSQINCQEVGLMSLKCGAGRVIKNAKIDLSAGIIMHKAVGDFVEKNEPVATLYSSTVSFDDFIVDDFYSLSDDMPKACDIILDIIS